MANFGHFIIVASRYEPLQPWNNVINIKFKIKKLEGRKFKTKTSGKKKVRIQLKYIYYFNFQITMKRKYLYKK